MCAHAGGNGPTASDLLDQLDAAAEEAAAYTSGQGYGSSRFRPAATAGYNMSRPRPPQAPIHPGSTPAGSSGNARFLAYNQLGCVVSKAVEDHHTVEVGGGRSSGYASRALLVMMYASSVATCIELFLSISVTNNVAKHYAIMHRVQWQRAALPSPPGTMADCLGVTSYQHTMQCTFSPHTTVGQMTINNNSSASLVLCAICCAGHLP